MSQSSTETGQGQEPATGAGAAAGATGQEPGATAPTGQEPGGTGQQADAGATFDASTIQDPTIRAYVEAQQKAATEARQEAAQHRVALQTATETAEQAQQRQAQEAETARQAEQTRLNELAEENRSLKVGAAITAAAPTAHDPAIVASIIGPKVTLDDKGAPTNVTELVQGLKTSHPYLFKRSSTDAGAGAGDQGATQPGDMNSIIQRLAKRGTRSV